MFHRILVPVDLSAKSQPAIAMAGDLAASSGAVVILLHVVEVIEHIPFDEMQEFYNRLKARAAAALHEYSTPLKQRGIEVEQTVVYGHRIRDIVQFAEADRSDVIVLSSHRLERLEQAHDWSISYAVALLAACPVLLVK